MPFMKVSTETSSTALLTKYVSEEVLRKKRLQLYLFSYISTESGILSQMRVKTPLTILKSTFQLKELTLINADLNDIFVENSIRALYKRFSEVFGATGASKVLHLLNPRLFAMWDDSIRKNYQINAPDENGYLRFLKMAKEEIAELVKDCAERNGLSLEDAEKFIKDRTGMELTKLLDELNYLKFTRKEFL